MSSPATAADGPTAEWIERLYGDVPGYLVVSYMPAVGKFSGTGGQCATHADAARRIEYLDQAGAEGVYLRATTVDRELGPWERGSAADSHYLPGLWADVDYGQIGHRHDPASHGGLILPPDLPEAIRLVQASGLPTPSLWVASGGGAYPWWILDEPARITEDNRSEIETLSSRWQQILELSAARIGYFYGAGVGDLSRVLRVPGTTNRKQGHDRACQVVADTGETFTLAQLTDVADGIVLPQDRAPQRPVPPEQPSGLYTGPSPLDRFAEEHSWSDILLPHGFTVCAERRHASNIVECFTRPGEPAHLCSAHVLKGSEFCLVAWSEEAGLPTGAGLTKARVAAILGYGGDLSALARTMMPPEETLSFTPGTVPDQPDDDLLAAFWAARPVLTHIHDFARARLASPWATFGAVLARVTVLIPWVVALPPITGGRGSLNCAVAVVGRSGAGKGVSEGAAAAAFRWPRIPDFQIGSGEAIAHCLKYRLPPKQGGGTEWFEPGHNALVSMPEVDKLAAQASRQGSTIMSELRTVWSGEKVGHTTADASRKLPIEAHTYRVALTLGVQPLKAGFLLDDAAGGFPQRLVWLPAEDPGAPDAEPPAPEPLPLVLPDVGELARMSLGEPEIEVCDRARQELLADRRARLKGEAVDELDSQRPLVREKIAAVLGILDGRWSITDEDWELSAVVLAVSDHTRGRVQAELGQRKRKAEQAQTEVGIRRQVATTEAVEREAVQRVCRKLRQQVTAAGEVGWSELRGKLASRDREYFEEAVEALVEAGQVTVIEHPNESSPNGVSRTIKSVT